MYGEKCEEGQQEARLELLKVVEDIKYLAFEA